MKYKTGFKLNWVTVVKTLVMMIISIGFLFPFYIIIRNASLPDKVILGKKWVYFPSFLDFIRNFTAILFNKEAHILVGLGNSALVSVIQVSLMLFISSLAGYALARIPFRYKDYFFGFILIMMMVPFNIIFIPLYIIIVKLGLNNTYAGIILPGVFSAFNVFMYRQFFLDFPKEVEESVHMDGLGYFGIWRLIVMPNAKSISVALGVIAFIGSWNNFLWPMVVAKNASKYTIQICISLFMKSQRVVYNQAFMGTFIAILPLIIVFYWLQSYIVQGLTRTGIKG